VAALPGGRPLRGGDAVGVRGQGETLLRAALRLRLCEPSRAVGEPQRLDHARRGRARLVEAARDGRLAGGAAGGRGHDLVRIDGAAGAVGLDDAAAVDAGGPGGTLRACCAGVTLWPLRTSGSLRAARSLGAVSSSTTCRALRTVSSRRALRARGALLALSSLRALRTGDAADDPGESAAREDVDAVLVDACLGGDGRAVCAGRSRVALRARCALRTGRSGRARKAGGSALGRLRITRRTSCFLQGWNAWTQRITPVWRFAQIGPRIRFGVVGYAAEAGAASIRASSDAAPMRKTYFMASPCRSGRPRRPAVTRGLQRPGPSRLTQSVKTTDLA
jgi:hypothetical protein